MFSPVLGSHLGRRVPPLLYPAPHPAHMGSFRGQVPHWKTEDVKHQGGQLPPQSPRPYRAGNSPVKHKEQAKGVRRGRRKSPSLSRVKIPTVSMVFQFQCEQSPGNFVKLQIPGPSSPSSALRQIWGGPRSLHAPQGPQ